MEWYMFLLVPSHAKRNGLSIIMHHIIDIMAMTSSSNMLFNLSFPRQAAETFSIEMFAPTPMRKAWIAQAIIVAALVLDKLGQEDKLVAIKLLKPRI